MVEFKNYLIIYFYVLLNSDDIFLKFYEKPPPFNMSKGGILVFFKLLVKNKELNVEEKVIVI